MEPCTKLAYATEKAAKKKLSGVRKKRMWQYKSEAMIERRVYQCHICRCWHLTSHAFEI